MDSRVGTCSHQTCTFPGNARSRNAHILLLALNPLLGFCPAKSSEVSLVVMVFTPAKRSKLKNRADGVPSLFYFQMGVYSDSSNYFFRCFLRKTFSCRASSSVLHHIVESKNQRMDLRAPSSQGGITSNQELALPREPITRHYNWHKKDMLYKLKAQRNLDRVSFSSKIRSDRKQLVHSEEWFMTPLLLFIENKSTLWVLPCSERLPHVRLALLPATWQLNSILAEIWSARKPEQQPEMGGWGANQSPKPKTGFQSYHYD